MRTSISRRPTSRQALERAGFLRRDDCRFLWQQRGVSRLRRLSFDGFRADKRKKLAASAGASPNRASRSETLHGEDDRRALWRKVFAFSERTFLQHGNAHYLSADFLRARSASACRRRSSSMLARTRCALPIAAAIFVRGADELCTVATGARVTTPTACISRPATTRASTTASAHGLAAFDPGTQGEHKLARGLSRRRTTSAHWLANEEFRRCRSVAFTVERARESMAAYIGVGRASTCPSTGRGAP